MHLRPNLTSCRVPGKAAATRLHNHLRSGLLKFWIALIVFLPKFIIAIVLWYIGRLDLALSSRQFVSNSSMLMHLSGLFTESAQVTAVLGFLGCAPCCLVQVRVG